MSNKEKSEKPSKLKEYCYEPASHEGRCGTIPYVPTDGVTLLTMLDREQVELLTMLDCERVELLTMLKRERIELPSSLLYSMRNAPTWSIVLSTSFLLDYLILRLSKRLCPTAFAPCSLPLWRNPRPVTKEDVSRPSSRGLLAPIELLVVARHRAHRPPVLRGSWLDDTKEKFRGSL